MCEPGQGNIGVGRVSLRVHNFVACSRANGPGRRAVIWVQGCSLNCPGCFNPTTHAPRGGESVAVDSLVRRLRALGEIIEGVTVSGGEPLQQRRALLDLLRRLRSETSLSVLVFTGYTWEEVRQMPESAALLASIDVLIAGRYRHDDRPSLGLSVSGNKSVHLLTDRYSLSDLVAVPAAEAIVTAEGHVLVSGIDPPRW